ncbi:hypothetical protein LBMAG42_39890 [Deltaproteobacteria bacterium]|nr:hypothetical protein LBMAG42_39890 [Deltaproteobacteria bacterium]
MSWEDVRAALLLVVIAVYGFAAAPLAHSANREKLSLPFATDELTRLQSALAPMGLHPEVEELADVAYRVSSFQADLRRTGLAPFQDFFRITGTGQAWGLFTYPDRFPARLVVEGRQASGGWIRLYASLDPDATFNEEKLVYRRIRGVYDANSERARATWDPFVSWVASEVFRAEPGVDAVRVSFQQIHTYEPWEHAEVLVEEGGYSARERHRP